MNTEKIDKCLEGIHRLEIILTRIDSEVEINTSDLAEHMRRTEMLEKKLSKVYTVVLVGAGFAMAHFGPNILKVVGLL
jgi:hypothetical protein